MGAVQDKFTSNANYTRRMNEVECEKQRTLQKLELEKKQVKMKENVKNWKCKNKRRKLILN